MLTSPVALPGSDPIREIGAMLSPVGGIAGATVIVACWVTPPAVTVIVAGVACVTADVVTWTGIDHVPAGMMMVAGTLAAGELLERFTTSPPAGAGPWRFTKTSVGIPPLTAAGESWSDCTASGSTVILSETETPLSVAVIVTGVGTETCPMVTWKSVQAWVPGIVIVAGTEAAAGFELVRAMVAPAAPTPAVSWIASKKVLPLYTACGGSTPSSASETGSGRRADRERPGRRRSRDGRQGVRLGRGGGAVPLGRDDAPVLGPGREVVDRDGREVLLDDQVLDVLERRVVGDLDRVAEDLRVGHVLPLERDRQRQGLPADGGHERRRRPDRVVEGVGVRDHVRRQPADAVGADGVDARVEGGLEAEVEGERRLVEVVVPEDVGPREGRVALTEVSKTYVAAPAAGVHQVVPVSSGWNVV